MNKTLSIASSVLVIVLLVAGAVFLIRLNKNTSNTVAVVSPVITGEVENPVNIVSNFYSWYLTQPDEMLNKGAYKDSPYLAKGWANVVSTKIQSFQDGGYDPFLCAQDIPQSWQLAKVSQDSTTAKVALRLVFGDDAQIVPIDLGRQGNSWQISSVNCWEVSTSVVDNTKAIIYYHNSSKVTRGDNDCKVVFGVERSVPSMSNVEDRSKAALIQLFKGPTADEAKKGFSSFFSSKTADILKDVKVEGKTAYVNLSDIRSIIPNASTSCGSVSFISEVEETLKHNRDIDKVVFAINGDPKTFYEWAQFGCSKESNNCDPKPFQ